MLETTTAERLRHLRETLHLNQKEFCKQIDLSQGRLSDIEAGKTKPSYTTLQAISEKFSISLDWLVTGKGQMFYNEEGSISDSLQLKQDEIALVLKYRELTERQKGRVDQQVDIYVAENKKSSPLIIGDDEESVSHLA